MKKYMGKVSAVFLLFLMTIFWTATIAYNVRAVPRDIRDRLDTGAIVRFSNAIGEGVADFSKNIGAGQTLSWFCLPGEIELNTNAGTSGSIVWYMTYRRLEPASRVVISSN